MNRKIELGEFLRARRAELDPEQAGLRWYGERRRVKGLRREELAQLAGLSVTYYTRLEQGRAGNISDSVLDAIARALRLSDDERVHVHDLTSEAPDPRRRAEPEHVRSSMRALLTQLGDVPGLVVGRRGDVLAWNLAAHALYAEDLDFDAPDDEAARPNMVRRLFLSEYGRALYVHWEQKAAGAAAYLRVAAARYPDDPGIAALVDELTAQSPDFGRFWAMHDVRECSHSVNQLRSPQVGLVTASEEIMPMSDDLGQRLTLVSAEPGSPSERALRLLAARAAAGFDQRVQVAAVR